MERIRERLERDEYAVDAHAVADAIVRRVLASRGAETPDHHCS